MTRDDFCIFILSYDRAGDVPTISTLEKTNYDGDWYIVIDHEDDIEPYTEEYGEERVIYFDKDEVSPRIDRGDNFARQNAVVHSRHYCFDLAEEMGYEYFMQLDDDYSNFERRFDHRFEYTSIMYYDLETYIELGVQFLESTDVDTVAMAQGGDFIGGSESQLAQSIQLKRKSMNTFIFETANPINFRGSINEDVNTYVRNQQMGEIHFTTNLVSVGQEQTQQHEGGLTDRYKAEGTYVKSMYTVLYAPSCTTLSKLTGGADERIHHKVNWRYAVPKILRDEHKKANPQTLDTLIDDD